MVQYLKLEVEKELLKEALKIPNDTHFNTPIGALLELALIQYGIEKAIKKGFTPIITPDVIKSEFSHACGFQPRDNEEVSQNYFISNESSQNLVLSATAEVPLAGLYSNKILSHKELPIKLVGLEELLDLKLDNGLCQHTNWVQVHIVNMIWKLGCQDVENGVKYLQHLIVTDYQSRRLSIRYKSPSSNTTEFAHTLNGTAVAIPRLIIAILENFQKDDGKVL
ncbi:seryl-tRNA synthetase [Rhizophagus clarus]|uniref:Seryl-tRNA synthetase n=1 Tax=Rhizophagus clarus TaxID=94130 RepID=A0A8H3LGP5_9GLOM|nr:seryl-tRNA synthetase [Rhizophagus clarus]